MFIPVLYGPWRTYHVANWLCNITHASRNRPANTACELALLCIIVLYAFVFLLFFYITNAILILKLCRSLVIQIQSRKVLKLHRLR